MYLIPMRSRGNKGICIRQMDTTRLAAWCAQAGLCVRCYLRVIGERGAASYGGTQAALRSKNGYIFVGDCGTCPACLGALQDVTLDRVPDLSRPHIAKVNHDGRYKVTASFPASVAIVRERALYIALRVEFSDAERPLSLREAFKLALADRLARLGISYVAEAELFIDISLVHPASDAECAFVQGVSKTKRGAFNGRERKRVRFNGGEGAMSTTVVSRVVAGMSDAAFCEAVGSEFLPPPIPESAVDCAVVVSVGTILLAGEYNKFSRVISQTPWRVGVQGEGEDAEPKYAVSVESVVCAGLNALFRPERVTFTAGGREDVDVRMLGGGRPFVVEIANPGVVASRVTDAMLREALAASEAKTTAVRVNNLRVVPKEHFADMRIYESQKRKRYRCVVWTDRAVPEAELKRILGKPDGFLLKQKTPLRVLHRRTLAVRERMIYEAVVLRVVAPQFFVLDIVSAAGTYIKEFVHGDNGRTVPNVGDLLGCNADILQLDVLGIHAKSTPT